MLDAIMAQPDGRVSDQNDGFVWSPAVSRLGGGINPLDMCATVNSCVP